MSYVIGDLVCVILAYVVCVLVSCALYYLEVKYRDWITCDVSYLECSVCHSVMHIVMSESSVPGVLMCHVLRSWNVVCVILSYM